MISTQRELDGVIAALQAKVPQKYQAETRQNFLQEWFSSDCGRHIGKDPSNRGAFARDAGFTSLELGQWGEALKPVSK